MVLWNGLPNWSRRQSDGVKFRGKASFYAVTLSHEDDFEKMNVN